MYISKTFIHVHTFEFKGYRMYTYSVLKDNIKRGFQSSLYQFSFLFAAYDRCH